MLFNPRELYLTRKRANAEHFSPYLRYVAQSGLLLVIAFLTIAFIDQYIKLIKYTPEQFPLAIIVTIVMSAVILYSPYRTWLKPADIIYVMPKQQDMLKYLNYCRQRGFFISFLPFIIVLVLVYILLEAYNVIDFPSIMLLFLINKQAAFYTLYNVNELTNKTVVFAIRFATTASVMIGNYIMLEYGSPLSLIVSAFVVLMCAIFVISKTRNFINWNQLIEDEQKKLHRTYRFLNLFVDVPHVSSATNKRTYLAQFANTIKFGRQQTFSYLHYLTFARSEVGGIYVRNILVGAIIAYIMAYTMLWNGYAALFFVVVFMWINAVQLSTLRQMHRYSVWQNIYPIPLNQQHKQMTSIELRLLLISGACLVVIPAIIFIAASMWNMVAYLAIAMILIVLWRLVVIRSRVKKHLK